MVSLDEKIIHLLWMVRGVAGLLVIVSLLVLLLT